MKAVGYIQNSPIDDPLSLVDIELDTQALQESGTAIEKTVLEGF